MQDRNLDEFLKRCRPAWFAAAACRQPHHGPGAQPDWHASGRSAAGIVAISICAGCPVRGLCLAYVETLGPDGEHGIWGGLSAGTREQARTGYTRAPKAA